MVEPLPQNKTQIGIAIGGPLFDYQSNTIPMPLSSITLVRGIDDNLSVYASVHSTALFYGVLQTELGLTRNLYKNTLHDFAISLTPSAHFMFDKWEKHFKFYPSVDVNFYSKIFGENKLIYAGMSNWFELARKRAHNENQPTHWIPALHTGFTYKPDSLSYTLELKYIAPFNSSKNIVVDYVSPWDHGAIGLYAGIGWTFQ